MFNDISSILQTNILTQFGGATPPGKPPQMDPKNQFFEQLNLECQCFIISARGGIENARLKAKAKDTKKIRGQGQGQPFSRAEPLEAKARDQRHMSKCSPKKSLQKFFSGDLQFIRVPTIFDWGRLKPQITCNDVIKFFPKRKFLFDKDIVGWKI